MEHHRRSPLVYTVHHDGKRRAPPFVHVGLTRSQQAQSSPPKSLQSSAATASAYPQLSNLYPSEESAAGPSTNTANGRPAAGPGAGFPARPHQPAPVSNAYGGYGAPAGGSNLYGNGYGGGMSSMGGSGMGQQGDKGEKNVAQLIVDRGNKWSRA